MKREEMTSRIQEGFFDLAPDLFDEIVEAAEKSEKDVVVEMPKQKKISELRRSMAYQVVSKVAILLVVIGLGIGIFGVKNRESVYVLAMDVNPSIQLEMDQNYYVRKMTGLNAEGEYVINKLVFEEKSSIGQIVEMITGELVSEGYLKENSGILFTLLKKDDAHNYEELKNILNQEIEKDVEKCGISGVKVAFQTIGAETTQTGKEILKKQMIEKYHLDDKNIDEMNIRDMIDYVENEKADDDILDHVKKKKDDMAQKESDLQVHGDTDKKSEKYIGDQKPLQGSKQVAGGGVAKTNPTPVADGNKDNQQTKVTPNISESKAEPKKTKEPVVKKDLAKSTSEESSDKKNETPISNTENEIKKKEEKKPESEDKKKEELPAKTDDKVNENKPSESENKKEPEATPKGNADNGQNMWPNWNGGVHLDKDTTSIPR